MSRDASVSQISRQIDIWLMHKLIHLKSHIIRLVSNVRIIEFL